jgi:2-(1,2-epoxy-1,2-dihydrophenyl)acetyl-CoA isomerase
MSALVVALEDGLLRITLNRPEAANAFDLEEGRAMLHAAIRADEDPAVRCVLITGTGRFFSAGGDLASFATLGAGIGGSLKEMTTYLHSAFSKLARMKAPLVTAVNGPAAGIGMSLAILGDLVFAARSANFTSAYLAAGLTPDGAQTFVLPRLVGMRRAQELFLTNRRLSAEEAVAWGLATQVVDDAALADHALAAARRLVEGPFAAYGALRSLLAGTWSAGFEEQMELEARSIAAAASGAEGQEGINAFLAKRKPVFRAPA